MAAFTLEQRRTLTLAATVLGSSLAFIDATVVFVALPTIAEDLDLGLTGQQWIVLSYSLALASLYLVGGAIGDRYGRRPTFIAGAAGFAVASAFAGFAPSGGLLILARALQGVAGAFLTTNSLALLRGVYGEDAGRAIGLWTAFTSVATIAGPPIGGALIEWVSWRWIFFINLPLAVLTVLLAKVGECNEQKMLRVGRLDIPGATLAAVGFGTLTYGLVEGPDKGFSEVWWAFVVAAPALVGFCLVEARSKNAMLPLALFRRRNFAMLKLLQGPLTGLPDGLAPRQGLAENSLGELGVTAQALTAEARLLAHPVSFEVVTSTHAEGIEDRITMAPLSARRLAEMVELGEHLAAIGFTIAAQALELRDPPAMGTGTKRALGLVRERVPFMGEGDPLPSDLEPVRGLIVAGAFVA